MTQTLPNSDTNQHKTQPNERDKVKDNQQDPVGFDLVF
jgi:hypothetical protein